MFPPGSGNVLTFPSRDNLPNRCRRTTTGSHSLTISPYLRPTPGGSVFLSQDNLWTAKRCTLLIMPLVAHSGLPTFDRLRNSGHEVLSLNRAETQDIRELHIGLLNMMPDAALQATERQFIRLVGSCNRIAQFYVYPFTVPGLSRDEATQAYINEHYSTFEELSHVGLDALIITGANVTNPSLTQEAFWQPLIEIADWAQNNVVSVLCSCLASHALFKHFHNIDRVGLEQKKWGVFSHRQINRHHPLLREINTRFDAPHSRFNDVSRATLEAVGLMVLAASDAGGVLLATSSDGFRTVYFQGHPEYDVNSLLKEYKREVLRFLKGELPKPPPYPENYFTEESHQYLGDFTQQAIKAFAANQPLPDTLERVVEPTLDNTWGDTGRAIFNNWLGLVYQLTNLDRKSQFMPGVNPLDPLGILKV